MNQAPPNPTEKKFISPPAQFLLKHRDEILSEWIERLREEMAVATRTSRPVLIDTLPTFIHNLAEALDANHERATATESSSVAQEHGGERARVTPFRPDQVVREYQILYHIVDSRLAKADLLTEAVRHAVRTSFDEAIQQAIMAFFLIHGQLRDQFVATLGHDLRNPLAAAKTSADLILRRLRAPLDESKLAEVKLLAEKVVGNLKRGDQMIQYLLDTNSLQAGENLNLNIQSGDLLLVLHALLKNMPDQDRARIDIDARPTPVFCDLNLMERAIENLISNAFKYGKPDSRIRITLEECLGRAIFRVHNWGDPIPIVEQERLFQSLHRAVTARQSGKPGWGLGLAFVRGVCEAHKGSIGVDSSEETGTTFTIDFPADVRALVDADKLPK